MFKEILIEVIAPGKDEEARVYREKSQRIFDRLGIPRKVWRIQGRKSGQVLVEYGPFDSREAFEAARARIHADKERQALLREWNESGAVVPGTTEIYFLAD
jgi:hypothetical protein